MQKNQLQIPVPKSVNAQLGVFFGFFFFNSALIASRSVLIAIALLAIYYACLGIQKALLRL